MADASRLETEIHELFEETADLVESAAPSRVAVMRERVVRGEYQPNFVLIAERLVATGQV